MGIKLPTLLSFQLILFDLIGKEHIFGRAVDIKPASFQLILFDLIGKEDLYDRLLAMPPEGFQLILFDLIGKVLTCR